LSTAICGWVFSKKKKQQHNYTVCSLHLPSSGADAEAKEQTHSSLVSSDLEPIFQFSFA
jgi:hypothetical protein